MNEGQSLRDAIRVLRIELRIVNDKIAMTAGLNPRDLDILDVIEREGPCTPTYLAQRTGYHRATLTGILARLEREQWLIRDVDPDDRRSARLQSAPRMEEVRRLYAPIDGPAELLARQLSDADRERLVSTLEGMASVLRQAGEHMPTRS